MKDKMKRRVHLKHIKDGNSKVDRAVTKSYSKEATHKLETSTLSGGFFTAIKKMLSKFLGFFKKTQQQHNGVSTKSYCKKFGGAFGNTVKKRRSYDPHAGAKAKRAKDEGRKA